MKALRFIFAAAVVAMGSFSAFAANWVFDPTAKTISDGDWTFRATVQNTTDMTVTTPVDDTDPSQCPSEVTPLDFSKPVTDAADPSKQYVIVTLNTAFRPNGKTKRNSADAVGTLTLPGEGLKTISGDAFSGCSNLSGDLIFPTSLTSVGTSAFKGSSVRSLDFRAATCSISGNYNRGAFQGCNSLLWVRFPAEGSFTLGYYPFTGCTALLDADCSGVVSVTVAKADYATFNGCSALTNVTLNSGIVLKNDAAGGKIGNALFNGNTSLKTICFTGAPPKDLDSWITSDGGYLGVFAKTRNISTIIHYEYSDVKNENDKSWTDYAADGVLNNFDSTFASTYLGDGVDPANRLLILDRSSGGEAPAITAVACVPYASSTNSAAISVEGANLLGGTVKIEILSGNTVVSSLDDLDDFGTFTLGGLEPDTDYTVRVTAVNDNGSDVDESLSFETFAVAVEIAPTAYYDPIAKVLAFFNDGIDRSNIGTGAVYSAVGTRTWGSDTGALQVPKVVFDPSFATARPTTCANWFKSFTALVEIEGIEHLDTSMCTSLSGMFFSASKLVMVDLSRFKTPLVTSIREMFRGCSKLTTIYANENFTLNSVVGDDGIYSTFLQCSSLCGGNGTGYGYYHGDYARVDNPPDAPGYFTYKAPPAVPPSFSAITVQAISNETATVCVRGSDLNGGTLKIELLVNAQVAKSVEDSDFGNFVFEGLTRGTTYAIKVTAINALGTTVDESQSFSTWGTTTLAARAVYTDFDRTLVFYYDGVDRTSWAQVFEFNANHTRTWDSVKDLMETVLFDKSFKTFRPKTCRSWFEGAHGKDAKGIRLVGMENLDTREVKSMAKMFYFTWFLEPPDTTYFNTKNVTSFSQFNQYDDGWSVMDCSSFDTRSATNMDTMFSGCTRILVSERFTTKNVTSSKTMFNCANVVGGEGTKYDSTHTDKEYARIDDPEHGMPGYFTYKAPPHQGMKIILR